MGKIWDFFKSDFGTFWQQIGSNFPKCEKSGTFSDQILVHFGSGPMLTATKTCL